MKILVTGGAGFIASHVVDAYINEGHEVVVVDNLLTGNMKNVDPRAKFIEMDIRDGGIKNLFAEKKFDVVNHHAAQMDVRKSVEDPTFDADVNVLGSLNLLENCKEYQVDQFIFSSTGGAIYGEQDYFPADEDHPQRPLSPYGITKLSLEKYLYYYNQVHGLNYYILRYANIYGPRQNPHGEAGVVAIFSQKFLRDEQPVINGDGNQTRDYVYVGDVVRANVAALGKKESDVVNIGTEIETDVNELFLRLRKLTGKENVPEKHAEAKQGEQQRSVIKYDKARTQLNWQPEVDLAEGLRRTVEFFKEQKAGTN